MHGIYDEFMKAANGGWASNATVTNVNTTVNVRSAPQAGSKLIGTAARGTGVEVLDEQDGWYRVRLSDGTIGYINKNYISYGG
jgi:uncharacterized protein YgiM (DUF1202 family)